jgi:hypothetical protein
MLTCCLYLTTEVAGLVHLCLAECYLHNAAQHSASNQQDKFLACARAHAQEAINEDSHNHMAILVFAHVLVCVGDESSLTEARSMLHRMKNIDEQMRKHLEALHDICLQQGHLNLAYVISTIVLSSYLLTMQTSAATMRSHESLDVDIALDAHFDCLQAGILVLRNGLSLMPALQLLPIGFGLDAVGLACQPQTKGMALTSDSDLGHLESLVAHINSMLGVQLHVLQVWYWVAPLPHRLCDIAYAT